MLYGEDVSAYQGAYQWPGNLSFGFAKATEGTFYQDPQFKHNWDALWSAKKLRGAYHFGHPSTSAVAQAQYFVAFVKAHGLLDLDALALDLEVSDGLSAAQVAAWAVQFVAEVRRLTGKNVFVYTMHSFIWGGYLAGLSAQPLWIADPNSRPGQPSPVTPWKVWSLDQYGQNGVDEDVLNGDASTWARLVNVGAPPPPPPPPMKQVIEQWTTAGELSLVAFAKASDSNPAMILQLTVEHSPGGVFSANVAEYINAGNLNATMPRGLVLYFPKWVQA